jgi:hypothetical protein
MNYLDYKDLEKQVLENGNIHAICYLLENANPFISSRIKSFKYTHSDLNEDETKILFKLNNLNEHDVLIGGEVHRVKNGVLKKAFEIDLFTILNQINSIKTKK